MAQDRRIATLQQHLNSSGAVTTNAACDVERHITAALVEGPAYFDTRALHKWLEHDNHDLRREMFEFLKDDLYKPAPYLNLMEFRELTLRRLQRFAQQKFFSIRDYVQDPRKFMAALECLAFCDYSLAIKAGVHYTLCGGTVLKLGTARHHQQYLPGIDDVSLPGCFGMTELGHGSNVMGIETTAEYQANTQTFLINTPRDEASKFWIGGAAQHGKLCTVFAQLTVRGRYQGVHVFAVRIRDDRGAVVPGVRIEDNGAKMGLNGVDNGRIWFKNVSVPRDALLDRYASVDPDGQYRSPVPTVEHRFGTMIGGLTTGRILVAQAAVDACKIGLAIAVRYSCQRTQFGDKPIMSYITHQRRLLPGLAATFALHLGMAHLKRISTATVPDAKLTHVLSSGLKAVATWTRVEVLQNCRECCGGMGFLAANKIGVLKTDMDVDTTFEGDNTVLMQQVVKALLEAARRKPETLSSRTAAVWAAGGEPRLPELQDLLAVREHSLTQQLATAVASRQGNAEAALEAEMDVVVQLGWAHVEAMLLQQFAAALAAAPRDASRALEKLCHLFALTRVERGATFFLAEKLLTPQDMEHARRGVNRICAELTENDGAMAQQLCDAWCIPPHLLQAPIAFDWRRI